MRVKATREGLLGGHTASGYIVDDAVPFVALPSTKALGKFVYLRNPKNGKLCYAVVLDVGPWNGGKVRRFFNATLNITDTDDDLYVFGGARPQSETGKDLRGRPTNKAGIDLGEKVWKDLGMVDNSEVEWEFLP